MKFPPRLMLVFGDPFYIKRAFSHSFILRNYGISFVVAKSTNSGALRNTQNCFRKFFGKPLLSTNVIVAVLKGRLAIPHTPR